MVLFFFFKQKTAYEMRISDWSSDVCSSDLRAPLPKKLGRSSTSRHVPTNPVGSFRRKNDRIPEQHHPGWLYPPPLPDPRAVAQVDARRHAAAACPAPRNLRPLHRLAFGRARKGAAWGKRGSVRVDPG